MAEYIDKNKIPWAKVDNPKGIFWERIVFESAINNITPADVVERSEYDKIVQASMDREESLQQVLVNTRDSYFKLEKEFAELKVKINKSIEEIRNLQMYYHENDFYDCKYQVLKILKSNIGE